MRTIRPANVEQAAADDAAVLALRTARDVARKAGSPCTLALIRRALRSAEGAQRHAAHRRRRTGDEQ